MNGFIEFFNFGFLKRLDRYLLLNYTLVWNSKLHYILFWGLIINIPLVSFLWLYTMELYQVPMFYNLLFYFSAVVSCIGLLYWIYKQTKYISVKEYGKFSLNGLKEYLLYFFSIAMIFSTPMIIDYTIISSYKYDAVSKYYDLSYQNVIDLTGVISTEEITGGIIEIAKTNYKFFQYDQDTRVWGYFWMYFTLLFLPLLLIIYLNIKIKYFLQSIIISIVVPFVALLLTGTFRIGSDEILSFFLWELITLILIQIIFRNKIRFLFLFLVYLFFSVLAVFIEMDVKFIMLYGNGNSEFSFLLTSLLFILFTISFIKNYMVKYASTPKE
ncbi:MAG: Unknown protein [uncultured Sulfurovum sp.]|uniref:Uncharacterized protein n=1 Tax=uncultured Sulfurovum sp. TaxID=269237 RepID=A0A6S6TMU2_9BACT|nr:MAG: Unknown protein [uncultured Sulfurovum sp.]